MAKKRIVCFGDSNTWGYNPKTGERYDENTRWPMRMQQILGDAYQVIEEGQNGRTISCEDPWEWATKRGWIMFCRWWKVMRLLICLLSCSGQMN